MRLQRQLVKRFVKFAAWDSALLIQNLSTLTLSRMTCLRKQWIGTNSNSNVIPLLFVSRLAHYAGWPDMGGSNNDARRRDVTIFCIRYVGFWFCVCLASVFLIGWPVILAWVGLAWGMYQVCTALQGNRSTRSSHQSKPKRRCRDRNKS